MDQGHRGRADRPGSARRRSGLEPAEFSTSVTLQPSQSDRFVWKWSADGKYSVSSSYRAFFAGSSSLLGAKELWRVKAPPKVKLFFWLALHRQIWTSARRQRHGLQASDECALCCQASETVDHLFLGCVFSREVWFLCLRPLQLSALVDSASRSAFDSLLLLITWTLWKERNGRVFGRSPCTVLQVAQAVFREGEQWAMGGFAPMKALAQLWSQQVYVM